MNLQPVPIAPAGPITLGCLGCGKRTSQAHGTIYADLDGPAFVAYYCEFCAAALRAKANQ